MTGWFAELSESTAKLSTSFPKPSVSLGGLYTLVGSTSQKDTKQPPLQICDSCQLWTQHPFYVRLPGTHDAASFTLRVACRRTGSVAWAATA